MAKSGHSFRVQRVMRAAFFAPHPAFALHSMKTLTRLSLLATLTAATAFASFADDAAKLEGKWTTKKTGPDGNPVTQVIEIKKNKFTFRVLRGSDDLMIFAEGTFKADMSGPFHVAHFTDIKGGTSESDTNPIDDDHTSVYVLSDDTLTVASNFDKERENQKPSTEVYTRSKK